MIRASDGGVGRLGWARSGRKTKRANRERRESRGACAVESLEGRTLLAAVLGGQLFSLGGPVQVEVLPATAGFTSELHLFGTAFDETEIIALNNQVGTVVDLGSFPVGQELIFGIFVRNTGFTYKMGPASRNPDNIEHATVNSTAPGEAIVGFEDLFGGGDRDFDDNVFKFTGSIAPNAPPVVDAGGPYTVPEGGSVTLSGTATDPDGSIASLAWDLDYDGVTFDVDATGASAAFSAAGLDGPSTRTVAFRATDDEGLGIIDTATVEITNVAPVITAFNSSSPDCGGALEGEGVTVSGSFSDAGIPDTHTAIVNWGDGTIEPGTVNESGGAGTVSGGHTYANGGIYTITITLTDDDGDSSTATALAYVSGVGVQNGQLQIIGTEDDDHVTVNRTGNGLIKVHADFLPSGPFKTFDASGVSSILAVLCHGNDHMTVAGNVTTPAVIDGGEGDDHLNGGGGPSTIIGGEGDDRILGGDSGDTLIGGKDADRIGGNAGDDVLVGGTTDLDEDYAALFGGTLITPGNVHDDNAEDALTGGSGLDTFFANIDTGVADRITGDAETLHDVN